MTPVIRHALSLTLPQFRLDLNHSIHGVAHWSRVWRNGKEICEAHGLNPTVPALFAFLHDSQRYNDGTDIEHGPRARYWLEKLYAKRELNIKANDFHLLCIAVQGHSFGHTDADPLVQVCWDSDRLDLGRCGTMPLARYLCTEHAKKDETIARAYRRSIGEKQCA